MNDKIMMKSLKTIFSLIAMVAVLFPSLCSADSQISSGSDTIGALINIMIMIILFGIILYGISYLIANNKNDIKFNKNKHKEISEALFW